MSEGTPRVPLQRGWNLLRRVGGWGFGGLVAAGAALGAAAVTKAGGGKKEEQENGDAAETTEEGFGATTDRGVERLRTTATWIITVFGALGVALTAGS